MRPISITGSIIGETLAHLQHAGRQNKECVVLWFAEDHDDQLMVKVAYRPDQTAREDVFRIPSSSMRSLMTTLSENSFMIAAQIHSHPREAFHSLADDAWAIVRHVGALSLVVPNFARHTTVATFRADTKVYRLDRKNHWGEVTMEEGHQCLRIT